VNAVNNIMKAIQIMFMSCCCVSCVINNQPHLCSSPPKMLKSATNYWLITTTDSQWRSSLTVSSAAVSDLWPTWPRTTRRTQHLSHTSGHLLPTSRLNQTLRPSWTMNQQQRKWHSQEAEKESEAIYVKTLLTI